MLRRLLITGGMLRENGHELGDGKYYGCARLLSLDVDSSEVRELISVSEGSNNFPESCPNLEFTAGAVDGNLLWLPMDTEIRCYRYPELELLQVFSHPCFNNVHSVSVHDNQLFVTSTGLDTVAVLDRHHGGIRQLINAEGKPVWHRFSEHIDYRKVHSTRPHDCHPNFVFLCDGQAWVTRCRRGDAALLRDTTITIDVCSSQTWLSVHDGIVRGGLAFFTTVDGTIVVADIHARRVIDAIRLPDLRDYRALRGWCRGLLLDEHVAYVGFSRLRKTRKAHLLHWTGKLTSRGEPVENCSIIAVDLERRAIIADFRMPGGSIDAIYSILPEPR